MRQKAWLSLAIGMLLALAFAASASAQGSTLIIAPNTVVAGSASTVNMAGSGFTTPGTADIRLSTRDAEPLRNVILDPRGRFSEFVPIPASLAPGTYLVIATQLTERLRQRGFTPARAKLHVVAAAGAVPPGRSPGEGPPLALVAGFIAFATLALGVTFARRRLRTAQSPARLFADASGSSR